ncbi:MAG: hypothetical protein ACO2ZP_00500 [Bacteriovoracaceae bacterium]
MSSVIHRQTIEALIRINEASSKDETRMYLNGVHFKNTGNKVQLTATDGHVLAREKIDMGVESLEDSEYIIHREDIPDLKKLLKSNKTAMYFNFIPSPTGSSINIVFGDEMRFLRVIEREFPKADAVISPVENKKDDDLYEFTINPDLVKKLMKALIKQKGKGLTFMLDTKNNLCPIEVRTTDHSQENIAIIMPMKAS